MSSADCSPWAAGGGGVRAAGATLRAAVGDGEHRSTIFRARARFIFTSMVEMVPGEQ